MGGAFQMIHRFGFAMLMVTGLMAGDFGTLRERSSIEVGGREVTIKKIECLPLVESEYTKRFRFESAENPKVKELRERYRLEEIVAAGEDEFEKQLLLLNWAHNQFTKFGHPSTGAKGALEILEGIEEGHTFFCTQFAQLFVSSAASLGWVSRPLALRRHQGVSEGGTSEHSTTEIWSNQHAKWIMLDPTSNFYLTRHGVPLNGWEIRQEWFYNQGKELEFVIGTERRRYRKGDLPVVIKHFGGGDLTLDRDELDKYGFIGYIPNTDLMDSGFDYGGMFITKDRLCDGTAWHTRKVPEDPAVDPYFPMGQAAVVLRPGAERVSVELGTLTPNLERFEVKVGNGSWKASGKTFGWKVESGVNRLEARTVNAFGVTGPVSVVEVE